MVIYSRVISSLSLSFFLLRLATSPCFPLRCPSPIPRTWRTAIRRKGARSRRMVCTLRMVLRLIYDLRRPVSPFRYFAAFFHSTGVLILLAGDAHDDGVSQPQVNGTFYVANALRGGVTVLELVDDGGALVKVESIPTGTSILSISVTRRAKLI